MTCDKQMVYLEEEGVGVAWGALGLGAGALQDC